MNTYFVTINGKEFHISIDSNHHVRMNGKRFDVDVQKLGMSSYSVLMNGKSVKVTTAQAEDSYYVLLNSEQHEATVDTERDRLLKKYDQSTSGKGKRHEIHAPMPALVVRIEVAVGDDVKEGQGLIVLEAMKMENELKAHQSGKVKEILVSMGKTVDKGQLLILLE